MSTLRRTSTTSCSFPGRLAAAVVLLALGPGVALGAGGDPKGAPWPVRDVRAGKQEVKAVAFDASGNAIVVGYTQVFGEDKDLFVAKVKADGTGLAWAPKVYDQAGTEDVATAVTTDAAGNIYVAGYVWNGSNADVYTAKYAANGTLAWQTTWNYAARNGDDLATAIAVDASGYVYVAGHSQAASGDDGLILKYAPTGPDVNGNPQLPIRFDGGQGNDLFYAVTAGTGAVVATGTSRNASGNMDAVTVKYSSATGAKMWEHRKASGGDNTGWQVKLDAAGNAVVAASVVNASSNRDFYVAKLGAATGSALPGWEKTYDGGLHDDPRALTLDAAGNVYVTGTVDSVAQAFNVYTLKYAADGTLGWGVPFNTTNGDQDVPRDLVVGAAGDVYVAGYSYSSSGGNYNYLTLKHKHDTGQVLWSALYAGPAGKDDQGLGLGLLADAVLVAGWSNSASDGTEDYDVTVVAYDPGRINAPSALTATVEVGPQVTLSWTDNAENEDGFCVQRRDSIQAFSDLTCGVPAHPGTGTAVYTDTTVTADTAYWYRVRARSATLGDSGYTNEVYVRSTVVVWGAPEWVYQHAGGAGVDKATAIAVGPDGHPVVTGLSFFMVDEVYGSVDYYTAKLDRASVDAVGDELWAARYADEFDSGDEANSVAVDSQNRVIVTGYATLDSGQAQNTNDLLTLFYPAIGPPGEVWDQYAGPGNDDDRSVAVAAAVDGSDNVAVVGYGKNAAMDDDIYVLKYNSAGVRQWAAVPYNSPGGGWNDYPTAVGFDATGNIIVVGYVNNAGNEDWWVAEYNGTTGALVWTPTVYSGAATGQERPRAVAVDTAGDAYVAGYVRDGGGKKDLSLAKVSGTTGAVLWHREYAGPLGQDDEAVGVEIDSIDGTILVAGTTTVAAGDRDLILIRYDGNGNVVRLDSQGNIVSSGGTPWQRVFDRPGFDDAVAAMDMDVSGNVCVAGSTVATAGGNKDALSVKYDYLGNIMGGIVYDGAASGNDEAAAVAVNRYGEAFIAGYETSAGGTADYLVLKCVRETLEVPSPVTVTAQYTTAMLTWSDNTFIEDGFTVQRKVGAGTWGDVQSPAAGITTWADTGLGTGQTYSYRVRSRKGGDVSRWSPEKTVTTLTPSAPGNLVAAPQNTTTIRLTWVDNTPVEQEDGFKVQRCEGAACTFTTFVEYPVAANLQTWDDVEVSPDKTYSYRIYAYKTGLWTSGYSAATASNTNVATPTIIATEPFPFNVSRVNEEKIDVGWSARTMDQTNFQLQRCTGDATACTESAGVWADVTGSPFTTTATSDTTAPAGGTYRYRIRAHKTATVSWDTAWGYSAAVVATITPPGSFTATVINTTQVNLAWTDGTANETNFVVQRCPGSGAACDQDVEFTWSKTLAAGTTSHTEVEACPGTQYTYRVRATNTTRLWNSAWATTVAAATPSPAAPTDLVATGLTESTISLSFDDNTLDRDLVTVYRCDGTGCEPTTAVTPTFTARPGAMYHFEEMSYPATAGDVKDSSTYLSHATSVGGLTSLAVGKFGRGATFDGVNDRVTAPHQASILPTSSALTIELWAQSTAANWPKSSAMVNKSNSYVLETTAATKTITFSLYLIPTYAWTALTFTPDASVDIMLWHHYAATYDGATMRLYVDGVEKASKAQTGTPYNNDTTGLYLGYKSASGAYWNGSLDDVAIHLRALPASELLDHAANGAQRGYLVVSGLAVGSTYTFKAVADKTATCKTLWPVASPTVPGATVAPPPPTNVTATAANTTQVNVGWNDNTGSETGFVLERCVGPQATCESAWFLDPKPPLAQWTVATPTVTKQDTDVCSGTQYTYRVRATKSTVPTWDTLWAYGTGITPAPQPATDVTTAALTESSVKVTVRDRNSDETGYRIERCTGTTATCTTDAQFSTLVYEGATSTFTEEPDGAPSLWLRMEEAGWTSGTAGQVVDSSGNTNHGTPFNQANTTAGGVTGRAATFDGTDDYVQLQYKAGVPTDNFTVEAWVKPTFTHEVEVESTTGTTGTAGQRYLFGPDYRDAPVAGAGVSVGTNGVSVYEHSGGYLPPLAVYSGTLSTTAWTHVVVTYTNRQPRIYVNGILVRTGLTSPKTTVYAPTLLGGRYSTACYYGGQVDNAVVLPRALTDAEVAARYAGQLLSRDDATASPSTAYVYRVTPYKTAVCPWTYQWTTSEVATPAPPKPTGLAATAVNSNRIDLAWNDVTGAEDRFRIERCVGDAATCTYDPLQDTDAKFTLVNNVPGTVGASAKGYSDSSLTTVCAGTTYTYRVRAEKDAGPAWKTAWSDGATRQVPAPAGPSPFGADRYSETQVNLTWTNPATNAETGLQVQRCGDAGCSSPTNVGPVLAAGTVGYSDTRLAADTNYWYRVQVQKSGACGWGTTTFSAVDPAFTELLEPNGLTASPVSTTSVNVAWTRNTVTDTDTLVQRCTGTLAACCPSGTCSGTFTTVGWVGPTATTYTDATAVKSTTYTYRVRAKSGGLASGTSQTWSYRAPLTGLTANTVVEVPVTWRSAMQADFDDLRFYDETAKEELPYWIQSKTDGTSATAWVKVGANINVYLYYGNAAATTTGSERSVEEFRDEFRGAVIDTSKWAEIDPDNSIAQSDDLVLNDVSDNWTRALISQATFSRVAGKEVYVRLTTGADTPGNDHFMVGWEANQTTNPSYAQLVHGWFWNNYLLNTYEKGTQTGPNTQSYTPNTDYEMRVVLKAAGATYYVKGGAYASWTLVKDTTAYSDATLRIAFTQYSHSARIHEVRVTGAKTGGVSVGTEGPASAGSAFDAVVLWTTGDSNADDALTLTPAVPAVTGVTSTTDRRVDVTWTDTNVDESSFVLERCDVGDACATVATFNSNAQAKATVGANAGTAADTTAAPSTKYYYRVRAHKDATNAWDTVSSAASVVTVPQKVSDLAAAADGSRKIVLTWTDGATGENGYEVEVLTWGGAFVKIASLPANSSTYTDAMAVDPGKTYTYRVRSYRTGAPTVYSPYSNEAAVTTPAFVASDTTCVVE